MKEKKLILSTIAAFVALGTSGHAADDDLFRANEFSLSLFGSYVDKDDADIAPGAGVNYFFTKHIGIGASTHWENYEGTFIDNMSGEAYFRFPLDRINLAPYGLVGFGYSFETEESFGMFGGGAEFRFNEKWGVFGDLRWQMNDDTDDAIGVRLGMRLVF